MWGLPARALAVSSLAYTIRWSSGAAAPSAAVVSSKVSRFCWLVDCSWAAIMPVKAYRGYVCSNGCAHKVLERFIYASLALSSTGHKVLKFFPSLSPLAIRQAVPLSEEPGCSPHLKGPEPPPNAPRKGVPATFLKPISQGALVQGILAAAFSVATTCAP